MIRLFLSHNSQITRPKVLNEDFKLISRRKREVTSKIEVEHDECYNHQTNKMITQSY